MLAKDCGQCWSASDLILEQFSLVASTAAKLLYVDSVPLSTLHESCALVNTALMRSRYHPVLLYATESCSAGSRAGGAYRPLTNRAYISERQCKAQSIQTRSNHALPRPRLSQHLTPYLTLRPFHAQILASPPARDAGPPLQLHKVFRSGGRLASAQIEAHPPQCDCANGTVPRL